MEMTSATFSLSEYERWMWWVCSSNLVCYPQGRVLWVSTLLILTIHGKSHGLPLGPKHVTELKTVTYL